MGGGGDAERGEGRIACDCERLGAMLGASGDVRADLRLEPERGKA